MLKEWCDLWKGHKSQLEGAGKINNDSERLLLTYQINKNLSVNTDI